jgi:hypothetical protein
VSFRRLSWGHWVAGGAGLALLVVMASDWYATVFADRLRRDERLAATGGILSGEPGRALKREIPPVAEELEKNAWEAFWGFDLALAVLVLLVAAVVLGVGAAYARAGAIELNAPFGLSAVAAVTGLLAAAALTIRLIDQPGYDDVTTVRPGAPLGLALLGLLVLGAARAARVEQAELARAGPAESGASGRDERSVAARPTGPAAPGRAP